MTVYKPTSSRSFFLELVLDILVFTVCALICLQVFAQAHIESSRSAAQSQLGIEAERIAEYFKASNGDTGSLASLLDGERDGDTLTWYYNRDLEPVTSDEAFYILTCKIDGSHAVKLARITLTEGTTKLMEFEVSSYRLSGGGGS